MNEHFTPLVIKYITGNADERERQLVEQWIRESQDHLDHYISLKEAWQDSLSHRGHPVVDVDGAFRQLRDKLLAGEGDKTEKPMSARGEERAMGVNAGMQGVGEETEEERRRRVSRRVWFRVAAAVLLVITGVGIIPFWKGGERKKEMAVTEVVVPNGKMKKILLPDSTEVWLNAGSHFRYGAGFGQSDREVFLEGEGYFAVHHNADKPFIVKAGGYRVQDIGTVFTVTAYPGKGDFETAVIEGRVEVSGDSAHRGKMDRVLLAHNEVLKIKIPTGAALEEKAGKKAVPVVPALSETDQTPQSLLQVIRSPQMEKYEGWKDNILVFDEETFEEVARRLERTFDVKIRINNDRLAHLRYTGKFNKVQTITDALKIIRLTTPIVYRTEGDSIIIN